MTKQEEAEGTGFIQSWEEKANRNLHLSNRRNTECGDRLSSLTAQQAIETSWQSENSKHV